MEVENILLDGVQVPHYVVPMTGDGACLFYSISYVVYGTQIMGPEIRAQVIQHVSTNWDRFQLFSARPNGTNYDTLNDYVDDMSLSETYGTTCELMAAGEIFPYQFQVYRDGTLLAQFGEPTEGVRRLRFSGHFIAGHFDVLISANEIPHTCSLESHTSTELPHLSPASSTAITHPTLPLNIHRTHQKRRSRVTDCIRKKQVREAAAKYGRMNPHVNRTAVTKYNEKNPHMHKKAASKYTHNKPQVHRTAVKKYSRKNLAVNRRAVQKYTYKNPAVNRTAVKKYAYKNPAVNKTAVNKYAHKHPQVHKAAVHKYAQKRKLIWKNKYNSAFHYNIHINYDDDEALQLGKMTAICKWCNARKWKEESAGMCCSSGKVQLSQFHQLPQPLYSLITNDHPQSAHFLNNIRKYNGCFQMTSFGAKQVQVGNFMTTFKVQGQVYHRIGALLPAPQQQPTFLQIYFVGDDQKQRDIRCGYFSGVKHHLVSELQRMLHDNNPYVKDFKSAVRSVPKGKEFQVVIHADKKPSHAHKGRFNTPASTEVAIVIVGQHFERRDILLRSKDNKLSRISETHRAYDALQYPLMFCRGEDGYTINLPQRDPQTKSPLRKTVSASNFYAFLLMEREGETNHILYFRDLLNQFLVDMYAKVETERLSFIRNNQKKLRVENYIHLQDAINKGDAQVSDIGKMILLPSTFTGGPRYMHERTQDAMTYVRYYGKPDLFITFTCNPKWTEVTEHLFQGQNSHHRHDLVARVFHLKVKKMMRLLTEGCIFGPVRCRMFTIEWQKRGLPHVHILLWLRDRISPSQIDDIIRAEIPDSEIDPTLYQIVKKNMIHGPCGVFNTNSPCMVNGICTKRYPRVFLKDTQTADDGYPQYRRRSPQDGGFTVCINGVNLDNRWVVPYSPVLSRTFNAHINVEICSSVKSIKYICKYVNKGTDQAAFTLQDNNDEITRYETGRYISTSEAVWRILCFPVHERFPPVMHLSVHLENGQRIYFTPDNVKEKIRNPIKTTLMAFFHLCKTDEFAKTLLYCEVPFYFVWKNNMFFRRKQGEPVPGHPGIVKEQVLGRVYTVHPNNSECYYLRLLLHEVRGPTSFTELKTVDGYVHPTFQSACRALGLLEDDGHWDETLQEAAISDLPKKIRELFAIMLVFCHLSDPMSLWNKYRDYLGEDIKRQMEKNYQWFDVNQGMDLVYNKCLLLLEDIVLAMSGQPLKQYGLPEPSRSGETISNCAYLREMSYDVNELSKIVSENEPLLNYYQKKVYNEITKSIDSGSGTMFFLDAPGGTGKTFLINLLLAKVRQGRNIAIAVASSGIAATLLQGGKTAHSVFKLPLNMNFVETPLCNISKQSDMAQVLQDCNLIVWDECTMAHKGGIEALDRTLQDIRNSNRINGGLTVLLAGDFRQTLPVVRRGTRADEVKACLKSSYLWPKIKVLSLKTNMRIHLKGHSQAEHFEKLLLELGDGKIEENDGKIKIPPTLCNLVQNMKTLTENIYPDLENLHVKPVSWFRERAILTPKNDKATEINNLLLQKFSAIEMTYNSIDSTVEVEDTLHYPVEFLHTLNPPGVPPHKLTLKIGTPVMLLRNLNPPKLCNGTRLQVTAVYRNVIQATIFTGCGQGESVFIPRIPIIPSDYPFQFKRLQFPLKTCFAMTINKAQGQSLTHAGVDLRDDCFSHGQLYVACSRVSTPYNLVILQPEGTTANVVYKEVLTS